MTDSAVPEYNTMARISFTIGLLEIIIALIPPFLNFSICCGPFGILGAILGVISLRQIRAGLGRPADRWFALFGIILGALPMLALCGTFIYYFFTGQIHN